jgi:hypothetical protein
MVLILMYLVVLTNERFTVVINTFKRPDMMKEAVAHYSSCPYVGEVYITWCEEERPPQALVDNYAARRMPRV